MKKFARFLIMTLVASIMVTISSCSKDENTDTSNNDSSGGSDEVIDVKYTMGYYHPAKKIKKISTFQCSNVYEFSWDGDNLKSIKVISYWGSPGRSSYDCHYSKNGYITSWTTHEKGKEDCVENITYEANSIYTNIVSSIGTLKWKEHTFDNNGVLIKNGSTLVTMQNGNVGTIYYDNHPNPLLNLWPPIGIDDDISPIDNFDISFFSKNNGLNKTTDTSADYYWYIEYDNDGWPIGWYSYSRNSSNPVFKQGAIEYYN